jgi:hypothetical protein
VLAIRDFTGSSQLKLPERAGDPRLWKRYRAIYDTFYLEKWRQLSQFSPFTLVLPFIWFA